MVGSPTGPLIENTSLTTKVDGEGSSTLAPNEAQVSSQELITSPTETGSVTEHPQGCVSNAAPEFIAPFTDLNKIRFISPIGVISHSVIHHSYVWIGTDSEGGVYEVPIYAPVDSKLTRASYYSQPMKGENDQWVDVAQYFLYFDVTCEVDYKFAHIDRVINEIDNLIPDEPANTSRTSALNPSLEFKAGDLVGYTRGTLGAHNFDFGVYNRSITNPFVNQARYEEVANLGVSLYADCPYRYFVEKIRQQIDTLLPGGECGRATQDVAGTIAGSWFIEQDYDFSSSGASLAIGTSVDPGSEYIIVHTSESEVRVYPDHPTYKDPADITMDHCYQDSLSPDQWVYLYLLSGSELAVLFGQGQCPENLPDDWIGYYR